MKNSANLKKKSISSEPQVREGGWGLNIMLSPKPQ